MSELTDTALKLGAVLHGMHKEGVIGEHLRTQLENVCFRMMVLHEVIGKEDLQDEQKQLIVEGIGLLGNSVAKLAHNSLNQHTCTGEVTWTFVKEVKPLLEALQELANLTGTNDNEINKLFQLAFSLYDKLEVK